jgi:hypothetical protein
LTYDVSESTSTKTTATAIVSALDGCLDETVNGRSEEGGFVSQAMALVAVSHLNALKALLSPIKPPPSQGRQRLYSPQHSAPLTHLFLNLRNARDERQRHE